MGVRSRSRISSWWGRSLLTPLVFLTGCTAPSETDLGTQFPSGAFSEEVLDSLWGLIQGHVDRGEIPGAVVLLSRDGNRVTKAVGTLDLEGGRAMPEDAIFRLASASKLIVSAAFMTLIEDGLVAVDDPISAYLPEYGELRVFTGESTSLGAARGQIRIVDLLRHTSGYGGGAQGPQQAAYREAGILTEAEELDWTHPWDLAEWSKVLASTPLAREPATRFEYGLSHDVLGRLIEVLTGDELGVALSERLLEPLGMRDTGFWVPEQHRHRLSGMYDHEVVPPAPVDIASNSRFLRPPRAPSGGGGWDNFPASGGLVSTAQDYGRLLEMILNDGEVDGARLLQPETVGLMKRNLLEGLPFEESFWPGVGFSTGMAVVFDSTRYGEGRPNGTMWWAGSTNVHFWMEPSRDFFGVLMVQAKPFGHLDLMGAAQDLAFRALR